MRDGGKFDFVCIWFLANLSLLAGTLTTFLDIEELKSVHYDIDILEKPVLYGRPLHAEVVYLSSKYGQRYECQLPDVTDMSKVQDEEKTAAETGISELLKPMELAPCLTKTKDWWTYEFCYGKHVRQFRLENSQISGDVITLGVFESEMDWENKSHGAAKRHRLNRYHSHRYVNGSKCDLTAKPREVEVRFMCAENQLDSMSRIDEPESCKYIITIHTMRICHHPYLKPPPKASPKAILCFPLLLQDEYAEYMHRQMMLKYSKEAQYLGDSEDSVETEKEGAGGGESEGGEQPQVESPRHDNDDDGDGEGEWLEDIQDDSSNLELLEEHHLQEKLTPSDPDVSRGTEDNPQAVDNGGMDATPDQLLDILSAVLKGVQGAVDSIDSELGGGDSTSKMNTGDAKENILLREKADIVEDGDEDDDEDGDEDRDEDEDDPEMQKLLQASYKDLTKRIMDLAGDDGEEAQRLAEVVKDIEASFESLHMIDGLLDEIKEKSAAEGKVGSRDPSPETSAEGEERGEGTEREDGSKHLTGDRGQTDVGEEGRSDGMRDDVEVEDVAEGKEGKDVQLHLVDTINKMIKQLKGQSTPEDAPGTLDKKKGDLSSRVRVRVTRVKLDKDRKASSEKELRFLDTDHRDIEEAISEQLEKSGLNTEGAGLELRVLSYVPEDWPDQGSEEEGFAILSEEDSSYFKNMIFGLITHGDNEEQLKQERLLQNYGFQWRTDAAIGQSLQHDELEQDQEPDSVVSPSLGSGGPTQGDAAEGANDPDN